jgi:hypothetical protein
LDALSTADFWVAAREEPRIRVRILDHGLIDGIFHQGSGFRPSVMSMGKINNKHNED